MYIYAILSISQRESVLIEFYRGTAYFIHLEIQNLRRRQNFPIEPKW